MGFFDTATTFASELANERLAFEILFVFILKRFNNSRQSKLHYRAVKCEVTVWRVGHGKKVSQSNCAGISTLDKPVRWYLIFYLHLNYESLDWFCPMERLFVTSRSRTCPILWYNKHNGSSSMFTWWQSNHYRRPWQSLIGS